MTTAASVSLERRTIEALRAGVPSTAVVMSLGSDQEDIEERYLSMLDGVASGRPGGMVVGGGFGAGKSHLLQHLGLLARQSGYAVSQVVVSKETLFHDPVKVAWSALSNVVVQGTNCPAIEHVAAAMDVRCPAYAELLRWASSPSSRLDERFAASLLLYAHLRDQGDEFAHALVRFWSGETLSSPDLRRYLRAAKEPCTIRRIRPADLARQRIRFAAKLMRAAGYKGWIVLFDEMELIARYPLLSRAKAYAEINHWFTGDHDGQDAPIGAVLAFTDDFPAAVLEGNNDRGELPGRVSRRQTPDAEGLARRTEAGMAVIEREMQLITPPDDAELDRAYSKVKMLHAAAFNWQPPDIAGLARAGTNRMRQYVRAWVNEWDLLRLQLTSEPATRVETIDAPVPEPG